MLLSTGRYPLKDRIKYTMKLNRVLRKAMIQGENLLDSDVRRKLFQTCVLYVEFTEVNESENQLEGYAVIDCANVKAFPVYPPELDPPEPGYFLYQVQGTGNHRRHQPADRGPGEGTDPVSGQAGYG